MKKSKIIAIVLAAGRGSRMRSKIPKPLVKVHGKPIVSWIVEDFESNQIDVALVINPIDRHHFEFLKDRVEFVYQENPKGTGHALTQALSIVKMYEFIYVFVGDSPFVGTENIKRMYLMHVQKSADCTILSADFKRSFPYARVIRSANTVIATIEEKNASSDQKKIKELFCSHYLFNSSVIENYLIKLIPDPSNKEIYLTEIINVLIEHKKSISVLKIKNWKRLVGLNTKEDISWIESQEIN